MAFTLICSEANSLANDFVKLRPAERITEVGKEPAAGALPPVIGWTIATNYISIEPGGNDIYLESGDEIMFTQGSVDLIGLVGEALFSVEEKD